MDLKVIDSVLSQLEEERGIKRESVIHAIEEAFAHAYKKEHGKRGQIVRAHVNIKTGETTFEQVKVIADDSTVRMPDPDSAGTSETEADTIGTGPEKDGERADAEGEDADEREWYNPEKHILIEDAQKIKKGAEVGDEIVFPLEPKEDFGRIAAQTAKQVMIQNIREAEKEYLSEEFGKREGEVVTGTVQRIDRGNIFIDLGRATGILPYEEQIPSERYKQGERVRGYLYRVEETPRGVFLKMSRSHPAFLEKLFEVEAPEVANGVVEIKAIAREAGSRSKIAVFSNDDHVDPVGSLVGQRGVRVSTVMSELGGEKIDIVEWSEDPSEFIADALSPAQVVDVEVSDEDEHQAVVRVTEDQQSLAIGRGGQNVRLAAKLTGWRIDIQSVGGDTVAEANEEGNVEIAEEPKEETVEAVEKTGETEKKEEVVAMAEKDTGNNNQTNSNHQETNKEEDSAVETSNQTKTDE